MIRLVSAAAAAASLMLAAAPVMAQGGAYYSATAAAKPKKTSFVTRNTIWKCGEGNVCTANKAPDRDMTVCAMLAQRAGELATFTANGAAFDTESLEKCNAAAR